MIYPVLTSIVPKVNGLKLTKQEYKRGEINDIDLKSNYRSWVDEDLYLLFMDKEDGKYFAVRASKRGNQVYADRTCLRFITLRDSLKDRRSSTKRGFYKVVFASLTYRNGGWENVGPDFNRFISALRKHGLKEFIRVWESQERGACHIHVLLFFETALSMFRHNRVWRLRKRDQFAALWPHGWSDFSGVDNVQRVLNYLLKYLQKTLSYSDETSLTLAKCWVYQKRAFSVSRSLFTPRLDNTTCTIQTRNCVLLGIGRSDMDLTRVEIVNIIKWDHNLFDVFVKNSQTLLSEY